MPNWHYSAEMATSLTCKRCDEPITGDDETVTGEEILGLDWPPESAQPHFMWHLRCRPDEGEPHPGGKRYRIRKYESDDVS